MKEHSIWIVIPAYNEGPVIGSVVSGARSHIPNVVVVDDCSRDKTGHYAHEAGAHVVRHPINRGQGAALRTGMEYAIRQGADIIVHFDADGQHKAEEIRSLIQPLIEGRADIVLGSRFLDTKSNVPPLRKAVLRGGILFTWIFSGIRLTDTNNGFRALSRAAAQKIKIRENRMAHASEILHEIRQRRLRYTEVPVTILYTDYSLSRGQSSLNALSIVRRLFWRKFFLD